MSYANEQGIELMPPEEEFATDNPNNGGDGKIYITISDKRSSNGGSKAKAKKDNEDKLSWQEYAILHIGKAVIDQSLRVAEWGISTIGNRTGDYQRQRDIDVMFNMINKTLNVGGAMLIGAKAFGVHGAVVTGAIAIGSEIVNASLNIYNNRLQNTKQNYEIEQLRIRTGLDGDNNGSRGTEN